MFIKTYISAGKYLILALLFLSTSIFSQEKKLLQEGGKSSLYTFDAITVGKSQASSDHIVLYGDFDRTEVPKDSLDDFGAGDVRVGTRSASKYIVWYITDSTWVGLGNGGGLYTTDWVDDDSNGVGDGWHVAYDSSQYGSIVTGNGFIGNAQRHQPNGSAEIRYLKPQAFQSGKRYDIRFMARSNYGIRVYDAWYVHLLYTVPADSGNAQEYQFSFTADSPPDDALNFTWFGGGYNRWIEIDAVDWENTLLPDSTRTLAKTLYYSDLLEDFKYYFRTTILQPNGRYTQGDIDSFYTPFPAPDLVDGEPDTNKVFLNFADNSTGVIDSIRIFVADSLGEAFSHDTTITEVIPISRIVTDGKAYYGIAYATYSNETTDTIYVEPISPLVEDFEMPTSLEVASDTTGMKYSWLKGFGYDSLIVQRDILDDGNYVDVVTLDINTEEYCDTLELLTDTQFTIRLKVFDGVTYQYTAVDTGTVIADFNVSGGGGGETGDTTYNAETGDMTGWTSVTTDGSSVMEARDTAAIHGSYGYIMIGTGSNDDINAKVTITSMTTGWLRAYVYIMPDFATATTFDVINVVSMMDNSNGRIVSLDLRTGGDNVAYTWRNYSEQYSYNETTDGFEMGDTLMFLSYFEQSTGTVKAWIYTDGTYYSVFDETGGDMTGWVFDQVRIGNDNGSQYPANGHWIKIDDIIVSSDSIGLYSEGGSSDTTWTAFNCADDGGIPALPSDLTYTDLSYTTVDLVWAKVDTATGYKVERKLGNQSSASFSQITVIGDTVDLSDYTNYGDNITGWTSTVLGNNNIGIDQNDGNDAPAILFDFDGSDGRIYMERDFTYDDVMWIKFDYKCNAGFETGTDLSYTIFRVYYPTNSFLYTFNLHGEAQSEANTWRVECNGETDIIEATGFTLGEWVTITAGIDIGGGTLKIYVDNDQIANLSGVTFDGATVDAIRIGTWGNATIPSDTSYWYYDNIRIAPDSSSLASYIETPDTTYQDINLTANTIYTYRVRGFNQYGNGSYSDTLRIRTLTLTPPNPIANFVLTDTSASDADFSFTSSVSAHDSTIFWWTTSPIAGTWTRVAVDSGTEVLNISGLSSETEYQVYGKAVKYIEGTANYSTSSNTVVFITTPPPTPTSVDAPTNFAMDSKSYNSITYSFTESATADYDSTIVYWAEQGQPYDSLGLANGIESFSLTSLNAETYYNCYLKAKKLGVYSIATATLSIQTDAAPPPSAGWTFDYYVSWDASGGGDGSQGNPWTIYEAASNVSAGDTISLDYGGYYSVNTAWTLSTSGERGNPIVWVGTNSSWDDISPDPTVSTVLRNTASSQNHINVNGAWNEFYNIVFWQTTGYYMIRVNDDHATFDSCSFNYTGGSDGTNNHFLQTNANGDNLTVRYTHCYRSPRTSIWVQWNSTSTAPDSAIIEYNTFTGHSGHPAFQIFPYPNQANMATIKGCIIRGNYFYDNTYNDLFYCRYNNDLQIYNNIAVNSGRWSLPGHDTTPFDTTSNAIIAYNTIINTTSQGLYALYDETTQQVTYKNNLVYLASGESLTGNRLFRFRCYYAQPYPPILRHSIDYNYYYLSENSSPVVGWGTPGCGYSESSWSSWASSNGFESHSTMNGSIPTFMNYAGNDFRPLNGSSPQVGAGTPISGITTDINGKARDASNPTIGACE